MAEPSPTASAAGGPRVSVLLPTRNRTAALDRAVASVRGQTLGEWELVIVDDASDDDTPARLAAHASADPRIHVFRHDARRGGAAARNTALGHARAPWIAFLDDDAEWRPEKLERQIARAREAPDALVYGPVLAVEEDGSGTLLGGPLGENAPVSDLVRGNRIDTSAVLVAAAPLRAVGGFDPELPRLQDWDLFIRLVPSVRLLYIDEVLVRTFRVGHRISTTPGSLEAAAERLAEKHADPRLLVTVGHMLLHEGHPAAARRIFARAWRRGGAGVPLLLRRALAATAPGLYTRMARLSDRLRPARAYSDPWAEERTSHASGHDHGAGRGRPSHV